MEKWEYQVLETNPHAGEWKENGVNPEDLQQALNTLGEEGWEVVGTLCADNAAYVRIILKRCKQN